MRALQLIGITGGIGSGKSTATKYLKSLGYNTLSLDELTHQGYQKGSKLYEAVKVYFPSVCANEVDRKALGRIVFNDPSKLKLLSEITHPLIIEMMEEEASKLGGLVFVEVPLLYESNLAKYFKEVWLVYVTKDLQISRVMTRDNLNYEEACKRVNAQLSLDEKLKLADKVVDGSSIQKINESIDKLLEDL